jgi:capsular polysaccharide export protein
MDRTAAVTQRLCLSSLSHLRDRRLRRILTLAGFDPVAARPRAGDAVAVWGSGKTADRGARMADRSGAALVWLEDAFLRSVLPGRAGRGPLTAPVGLLIDRSAPYYDASRPSDLETLLRSDPLDHSDLLSRARAGIADLIEGEITKYTAYAPDAPLPDPGYVLVIDQTRGDASIRLGGASGDTFREMLVEARLDHPHARIVVKAHPETARGLRSGHFGPGDADDRTTLLTGAVSPWHLLSGAVAVYTVTSQMGFEAILAGHRPQVFGQPFYAGWGLTEDRQPMPRRDRVLTRAQLFAGAMLLYPHWYDPARDRLGRFEDACAALAAETRAWREDAGGLTATGMRLWKRAPLRRFYGPGLRFAEPPARAVTAAAKRGTPLLVWASKESDALRAAAEAAGVPLHRVEDGLLRSRGLGADLVPPLSLIRDPAGIYYDPTRPSAVEAAVARAARWPAERLTRARDLRERLVALGLTKYNLPGLAADTGPPPGDGRLRLLVPGQVEDDASIRLGAGVIRTNAALLEAARAAHPEAWIVYKPHPDVEAGLRPGALPDDARALADVIADRADPLALLAGVDRVWTMTSGLGFEALLRAVPVTTLGTPFYAGWGLTDDRDLLPAARARRQARPPLDALVQAVLIDVPRYHDPVTGRPCTAEVVLDRLAEGRTGPAGPRWLAKLQGALAGQSWLWR